SRCPPRSRCGAPRPEPRIPIRSEPMTTWQRLRVLSQLGRAVLTWFWHDTRYPSPFPGNPRFMDARTAAALIADGDVVAVSGLGGNQRASIVFWGIRERFEEL